MAARLITDTMKFDHINPVLYNLHWLPVNFRIQFKILMITFKAIHGMAPSYLSDLICIRSSSRYSLRNNDTIFLERPKWVMRTTLGARSFHASAPALWNNLPAYIRVIDSLALFKSTLKTYLFKLRSNSLRSTERKLFYPSIPVIMRHTRNMVGYASGSKCSLIFYITLLFVCLFFTISNKERVYSIISHFFFFTINNKLSIYNVVYNKQ